QVFAGDPEHYKVSLQRAQSVTAKQLQAAAGEWLGDGDYNLEVHPFPSFTTAKSEVDRSKLPDTGTPPDARFPQLETAMLDNGLKLILAERHGIPAVTLYLTLDAGFASDATTKPGTAKLAMNMLDEGTEKRTSLEISEQLGLLGASLFTGSDLDTSTVGMTALKAHLDASLEIFGDVILNPSFPESDFQRLKKQQLDAIEAEKVDPHQMALRVLPQLLYGKGNAYALPLTGSGTGQSVESLTRNDVKKFHETWFYPDHATLVVVGDTTLAEIKPKIERLLSGWKPGQIPTKNIKPVELAAKPSVYLLDRPGSLQSLIAAAEVTVPKANPMEVAIQAMNNILGGQFTSRINMNLREDKHWSYGAHSRIYGARGQRPFVTSAPVQTDKTKESMVEMAKELRGILTDMPITEAELSKVKKQETLELAGKWETSRSVATSIAELVRYGLPLGYYNTLTERIRAMDLAKVTEAARSVVHPEGLVWVIVGDREKIEPGIRELGLGEIQVIDADGIPVK
ncbi:MAG: peptidase domain protein, partial [Verrucomicrobiales bacterium]|nr:peptidase domain protein [Verrucomicrobiales bacterium]